MTVVSGSYQNGEIAIINYYHVVKLPNLTFRKFPIGSLVISLEKFYTVCHGAKITRLYQITFLLPLEKASPSIPTS
jgi:hypothetical protein